MRQVYCLLSCLLLLSNVVALLQWDYATAGNSILGATDRPVLPDTGFIQTLSAVELIPARVQIMSQSSCFPIIPQF